MFTYSDLKVRGGATTGDIQHLSHPIRYFSGLVNCPNEQIPKENLCGSFLLAYIHLSFL